MMTTTRAFLNEELGTAIALLLALAACDGIAALPAYAGDRADGEIHRVQVVRVDDAPSFNCAQEGSPVVVWRSRLGLVAASPVIAEERILIGTSNADKGGADQAVLKCLNLNDGRLLWQRSHARIGSRLHDTPGTPIMSRPTVDGDRVYYVSNRGELTCLDLDGFLDGQNDGPITDEGVTGGQHADVVWRLDMIGELGVHKVDDGGMGNPLSSPLVIGDVVYCVTGNGSAYKRDVPAPNAPSFLAVRKDTGKILWNNSAPGKNIVYGQWSSPAFARVGRTDHIIFGGGDGCLYGVHPNTGQTLWKSDLGGPAPVDVGPQGLGRRNFFVGSPVVSDGVVYVGLNQNWEDNRLETRRPLYAVELRASGQAVIPELRWSFDPEGFDGTHAAVAVEDGHLYAVSTSGKLYAIDAASGEEVWRSDLKSQAAPYAAPYVHEGRLYVATDSDLFVFATGVDPRCIGRYTFDSTMYGSTPVVHNGIFCVASGGDLWALEVPPLTPVE